jgi:hypothetical protein
MQHSSRHLPSEQFEKLSGKPYDYNNEVVLMVSTFDSLRAMEMVRQVMPVGELFGIYKNEEGLIILHFEKVWHPATMIRN